MSWWCLYREWGGLAYNLMANKPSNQNLNSGYSDFIFSSLVYSPVCACMLSRFSCVWVFATLWTIACQAPQSMRFSRQEDWSGLPCSPPGNLPDPGIESMSPALQVDSLLLSHQESPYSPISAAYLYCSCIVNLKFSIITYFSRYLKNSGTLNLEEDNPVLE